MYTVNVLRVEMKGSGHSLMFEKDKFLSLQRVKGEVGKVAGVFPSPAVSLDEETEQSTVNLSPNWQCIMTYCNLVQHIIKMTNAVYTND